jgi:hypothetical protein
MLDRIRFLLCFRSDLEDSFESGVDLSMRITAGGITSLIIFLSAIP